MTDPDARTIGRAPDATDPVARPAPLDMRLVRQIIRRHLLAIFVGAGADHSSRPALAGIGRVLAASALVRGDRLSASPHRG